MQVCVCTWHVYGGKNVPETPKFLRALVYLLAAQRSSRPDATDSGLHTITPKDSNSPLLGAAGGQAGEGAG